MKIQYIEFSLAAIAAGAIAWPISELNSFINKPHDYSAYPRIAPVSSYVMKSRSYTDKSIFEQGLPVSDQVAQMLGAKDWNDWVTRVRPRNKNGVIEHETEQRQFRGQGITVPESLSETTFALLGEETEVYPYVDEDDSSSYLDGNNFIGAYPIGTIFPSGSSSSKECDECCVPSASDTQQTSVPEPSILALLLAGFVGLLLNRRGLVK